jgi:hypothetical protein
VVERLALPNASLAHLLDAPAVGAVNRPGQRKVIAFGTILR